MRVRERSNVGIILVTVIATALILGLAVAAGYLFWQNRQLKNDIASYAELEEKYKDLKASSPQGVGGLNDAEQIIREVGMLAELPQTEVPTLLPLGEKDKEAIKTIEFFKKAVPGDYVLVYKEAKFAVLYRHETYKIINMGPQTFSLGSSQQ
jgi:hypothetical protein